VADQPDEHVLIDQRAPQPLQRQGAASRLDHDQSPGRRRIIIV
jgi:hypothetical protein